MRRKKETEEDRERVRERDKERRNAEGSQSEREGTPRGRKASPRLPRTSVLNSEDQEHVEQR